MTATSQLHWKVRAYLLLRRTTRPESSHPGNLLLTAQEVHLLTAAMESGFSPKEIVRVLVRRDKQLQRQVSHV